MKKYLALILALVLVAGLFACGTKEPQNGTDTQLFQQLRRLHSQWR